jgi:hypothetical protein
MPVDKPRCDDPKKIIIRRIVRNYINNRLDTLCLAFDRLPEQVDEGIWLTAEYQKWARNEWLSENELERLMVSFAKIKFSAFVWTVYVFKPSNLMQLV